MSKCFGDHLENVLYFKQDKLQSQQCIQIIDTILLQENHCQQKNIVYNQLYEQNVYNTGNYAYYKIECNNKRKLTNGVCTSTLLQSYCQTCDTLNDGEICLECQNSNQYSIYCKCLPGYITNQNTCEQCDIGYYYDYTEDICSSTNQLEPRTCSKNDINICKSCSIINEFCTECLPKLEFQNEICIKCEGNRIPPNCQCPDNLVGKQGNMKDCVKCQDGEYFDIDQDICSNSDTNYNCYYDNICKNCQDKFNQYCGTCDYHQCLTCSTTDRILPDCICPINKVHDYNTGQCQSCNNNQYLNSVKNQACSQQDFINQTNDCTIDKICVECTVYNQFCLQCTENQCIKCEGQRVPPNCLCENQKVPSNINSSDCQYCQNNQFYDFGVDNCHNNVIPQYTCTIDNTCVNCQDNYNDFCLECDQNKCTLCQGNRIPPNCLCPNLMFPSDILTSDCQYCLDNQYIDESLDTCHDNNAPNYTCTISNSCINCSNYNIFCEKCDDEICFQCEGNRVVPNCECQYDMVPFQTDLSNCEICPTGYYYDIDVSTCDAYTCTQDDKCSSCFNHNQFCTQCNYYECLKCEGNRVPPNCLCSDQQYPSNTNTSDCDFCPNGKYYDQSIDSCHNNFSPQYSCTVDNSCLDCTLYNTFCTSCDQNICFSCQGNRNPPNCVCESNTVQISTSVVNCVSCGDGYYYDTTISSCDQYTCVYEDLCLECKNKHNQFCLKCNEDQCFECEGNRNPPNCLCDNFMLPSSVLDSDCQYCKDFEYFDTVLDTCHDNSNPQYTCTILNTCFDCATNIQQFCTKCDMTQCFECQGNRIAPNCICEQQMVPYIINMSQCEECPDGLYYDSSVSSCDQYSCTQQDKCLDCKDKHNIFCTKCNEDICIECEGERVPNQCLCQLQQISSETHLSDCQYCKDNQFFNEAADTCHDELNPQYDCDISNLCQDCTYHNQYCTKCDQNQCFECAGNRIAPFCYCQHYTVPESSDLEQCIECLDGTYYDTSIVCGPYDCTYDQLCLSCQSKFNEFCTKCNEEQCIECTGNRDPPYCFCPQQMVPYQSTTQICESCLEAQFYNNIADTCRDKINLDYQCYQENICVDCSSAYNKYCSQCDENQCLVCKGNRIPPFCKCPLNQISQIGFDTCINCPNKKAYDPINDMCSTQQNLDYDCFEDTACFECSTNFYKCEECQSDQCLKCQGNNRVLPDCKCEIGKVPEPENDMNCISCSDGEYFDYEKYALCGVGECSYEEICVDCTKINKYCTLCLNGQNNQPLCIECDGDNRSPPFCLCSEQMVPQLNNEVQCVFCESGKYYDEIYDFCKINQNFDCNYDEICQDCSSVHNQFCLSCTKEKCTQCDGNRVPPLCKCPFEQVAEKQQILVDGEYTNQPSAICLNCESGTLYNTNFDTCVTNTNKYDCFYEEICQDCAIKHNKYCTECTESQCTGCQGNREAPYCQCSYLMAAKKSSPTYCQACDSGYYLISTKNSCYGSDVEYDCWFSDLCGSCSKYNQYCTLCNDDYCSQCDGNRVAPECKCQVGYVATDNSPIYCTQCDVDQYYDYFRDLCRADLFNSEEINCYFSDVCRDCSNIDQFCIKCDQDRENEFLKCNDCSGNLQPHQSGKYDEYGFQIINCLCPEGYYSFDKNSDVCFTCIQNAICYGGDVIEISKGYFRFDNQTDQISKCLNNKESCIGGTQSQLCEKGYTGALCESCDYNGMVWGEKYGKTGDYECSKCNQTLGIIKVILYVLFFTFFIIGFTYIGIKEVQTDIIKNSLMQILNQRFLVNFETDSYTIYLKILMQFSQQIQVLMELNILDFSFIYNILSYFGNPGKGISYSLDCLISDLATQQTLSFIRILFLLIKLVLYLALSSLFFIFFKKKLYKQKQTITYKPRSNFLFKNEQFFEDEIINPGIPMKIIFYKILVFIFIDFQPSIIQVLVESISCKNILGETFQVSNTSVNCSDSTFKLWAYTFSLPLFIIFGVLLPIILFLKLKSHKEFNQFGKKVQKKQKNFDLIVPVMELQKRKENQNINEVQIPFQFDRSETQSRLLRHQIQYQYGFMYLEYKEDAFYWELIKVLQQTGIVFFLTFYTNYIYIKGILCVLIIYGYGLGVDIKKPFIFEKNNKLESEGAKFASLSILIGLFIYENNMVYLKVFGITLLAIFNSYFVLKVISIMIKETLRAYKLKIYDYKNDATINTTMLFTQRKDNTIRNNNEYEPQSSLKNINLQRKFNKESQLSKFSSIQQEENQEKQMIKINKILSDKNNQQEQQKQYLDVINDEIQYISSDNYNENSDIENENEERKEQNPHYKDINDIFNQLNLEQDENENDIVENKNPNNSITNMESFITYNSNEDDEDIDSQKQKNQQSCKSNNENISNDFIQNQSLNQIKSTNNLIEQNQQIHKNKALDQIIEDLNVKSDQQQNNI